MRKGIVTLALAFALLVCAHSAQAQPAGQMHRIGFLGSSSSERNKTLLPAFQQRLRELGYSEGKNIVIEHRYAAGQFGRLPQLAGELVRLKVDILVAEGAPASHAAKAATQAIPIVMTNAADPVGTGLVISLARPGGNVTGLSDFNSGVVAKRLELLKEVVPSASRVAVFLNPGNPTNPPQLKLIQSAAPSLGVTLLPVEVKGPDDIRPAFAGLETKRPDALLIIGDPMLGSNRRRIIAAAGKIRLPAIFSSGQWVSDGGLMSYGTDFADLYRRAALYVDKILKGAKPADLPVEQPIKFELVINLKTAKALGITIPPEVLQRADRVIR